MIAARKVTSVSKGSVSESSRTPISCSDPMPHDIGILPWVRKIVRIDAADAKASQASFSAFRAAFAPERFKEPFDKKSHERKAGAIQSVKLTVSVCIHPD